jgi:hypothetical protein
MLTARCTIAPPHAFAETPSPTTFPRTRAASTIVGWLFMPCSDKPTTQIWVIIDGNFLELCISQHAKTGQLGHGLQLDSEVFKIRYQ